MKKTATYLCSLFLIMALIACGEGESGNDASGTTDTKAQAAKSQVQPPYPLADSSQIQTVDGVQIYVVERGTGAVPKPGSTVVIDYHGYLTDGSVFDSSFDTDGPVNFPLNNLIRGWQIGLTQVPSGSRVKLIIPPELGYGSQERPGIPANSTLIFDIELFSSY
jgi:FKBP-type peptidyl-prolyl cis-trans isomerase FkpA